MSEPQKDKAEAEELTEQEQGALTASDIISLQEYLDKMEKLGKREPPMLSGEFWDKFFEDTKGKDEIPPEYQDKVCLQEVVVHSDIVNGKHQYYPEGITKKAYCDIVWEKWNSERQELEKQYREIVLKALKYAAKNIEESNSVLHVDKLLKSVINGNTAELPKIASVIPQYHVMSNDNLTNKLTSYNIINAGAFDMTVINGTSKRKEITAYTIASYDQDSAGLQIADKLTEYERQVSDAVISIWEETQKSGLPPEFTTDMVFRAMPGSSDKPSPQQAGAITKAIEKLRNLKIYLDVTDEMRTRHIISEKQKVVYDDMFLSAARVTRKVKNGGQTVTAYHLHTEPLILKYCKLTNQLITVNPKLLEIKKIKKGAISSEPIYMNEERQAITGYILRRIAIMKNDKKNKKAKQSNTILFQTLYEDIGISDPDKKKAAAIRNFCFDILDYYKAEKNYITGYKKQVKGRSITGVTIEI